MTSFLIISQIIVSILLVIFILLQSRGTALGSSFGQGGEFHGTKRGFQKTIFQATIVLGVLFILLSFLNLLM
jgi:preprotein translocase subunit SecG